MNQEFIDQLAQKLQTVGTLHAIGETWISIDSTIPAGGIPYLGQLVNRATWSDLFAWATAQGKVKAESEWQSYASANGGNCPFYSDGDGSTTFRMPCIKSYLKGADTLLDAGSYTAEGLPNITGVSPIKANIQESSGAFYVHTEGWSIENAAGGKYACKLGLDASRSNSIYGNSSHVTPETNSILIGVYAVGIVANVGSADATQFLAGLAKVEANLESHIRVVEAWSDGTNWYRKWSDGWVEQGGRITPSSSKNQYTVSFPHTMANTNYTFSITEGRDSDTTGAFPLSRMESCTTSSMVVALQNLTSSYGGASWMVEGWGE